MNSWVDPIIPISDITVGVLCSNLATLYSSMTNSSTDTIAFEYYLVKTNTLILLEYVTALEYTAF